MTASAADWSEHDLDRRFGADAAARRARRAGARRSTGCWTASRRACATSSACRPSCPTSCARRWRGSSPRSSSLQRRERRPRTAARRTPSIARSAEQMERHPRDADGRRARRGAARRRAQRGRPRRSIASPRAGRRPLAERDVELEVDHPAAPVTAGVDARGRRADRRAADRQRAAATRARAIVAQRGRARRRDRGQRHRRRARHRGRGARARLRARAARGGVNGHGGAGLGLPLARRLRRAIGGDVTLRPRRPARAPSSSVRLPA